MRLTRLILLAAGCWAAFQASSLPAGAGLPASPGTQRVFIPLMRGPGAAPPPTPPASAATQAAVALGAYVDNGPWDPGAWSVFINLVGRAPAILMWYQGWGAEEPNFRPEFLEQAYGLGAVPMITWEPWDYRRGRDQPEFALRNVISGNFDGYIRAWARASKAYGRPYLLRFAHEMNTQAYPWGCGVNGNRPEDYIRAWRHVRQIFAEEGAANVSWVWAPNVEYPGTCTLESLFPGEDWVDWVGIDGYNGGTGLPWGGWLTFSDIFGPTYRRLAALSARPIMITELASAEEGGDKGAWIRSAFLNEIPQSFPRVKAVVWFHARREADWRVDSSPGSLAAFREILSRTPIKLEAPGF